MHAPASSGERLPLPIHPAYLPAGTTAMQKVRPAGRTAQVPTYRRSFSLLFVRFGVHEPVQFRVLGEIIPERQNGVTVDHQPFARRRLGDGLQLLRRNIQPFLKNFAVSGLLIQQNIEVAVVKDILNLRAG